MSLPRWRNIARYVHCDLQLPRPGSVGSLSDYDGIGMIWHRSPLHRAAHLADLTSKGEMEADEAETFAAPIRQVCLVAREECLEVPNKLATWKLVRFANGPSTVFPSPVMGLIRNHALVPEEGERWGLDHPVVEEFWFAGRKQAEDAALNLHNGATVVLGRDTLLYP